MIEIKDFQVIEPSFDVDVLFSKGLKKHVIKHVFNPADKWQEFFSNEMFNSACYGYGSNGENDADFLKLCSEYEKLVSDILRNLCSKVCCWHFHFLTKKEDIEGEPMFYQTIEAIDIKNQIKIIAESFVRKDEFSPYIICTAFRYWCKNDNSKLAQKYIDKQRREKTFIRNNPNSPVEQILLVDHWGEDR